MQCWASAGWQDSCVAVWWQACRVAVDGWSHFLLLAPPSQERRPGGAGARPPSRKSRSSATACTAGPPSRSFRVRKLISEPAHRCTRPLTSGLFHCGAEVVTAAPRNQPPVLTLWCAALRHPQPVVVTRWENITSGSPRAPSFTTTVAAHLPSAHGPTSTCFRVSFKQSKELKGGSY